MRCGGCALPELPSSASSLSWEEVSLYSTVIIPTVLTRRCTQQLSSLDCLRLVLGERDRVGWLLVYCLPCCPKGFLLELSDLVLDVMLETPRLETPRMLGDFNIHVKILQDRTVQDVLSTITTLFLLQVTSGPIQQGGHTVDLVFCSGQVDLRVEEMKIISLAPGNSAEVAVSSEHSSADVDRS